MGRRLRNGEVGILDRSQSQTMDNSEITIQRVCSKYGWIFNRAHDSERSDLRPSD